MSHNFMKIPNKGKLQQITLNHSYDIEFKDFMKLNKYTKEPFSFLVNNAALPSDNPLKFKKNLLKNDCLRESQKNQWQDWAKQSSI